MWDEPILHVDMDSFFVEVERLRDPDLIGKAVAVGGAGPRGVVASASYEARTFGVRSAMPTADALRLCPTLVVISSDHSAYGEASEEVFRIFRSFSPSVEGLSLDEAFIDTAGLSRHFESSTEVGESIRHKVKNDLGLPCSVGVAANKFVAKLASEAAKPDGLVHVPVDGVVDFLRPLSVSALWGVGPATEAALANLGVTTVGEVAELPRATLERSLGPTQGSLLFDLARGVDHRSVEPDNKAKSISVEETYTQDLSGKVVVETAMLAHAQRLSGRLRRAGLRAGTLTLKLRYDDFTTITRSTTPGAAVSSARDLFEGVKLLLDAIDLEQPVRLLGLGGSNLEPADRPRQVSIESSEEWEKISDAVAEVHGRFGDGVVKPARLAQPNQHQTKNSEN